MDYQTIQLFDRVLFTKLKLREPMHVGAPMPQNESCFTYIFEGENLIFFENGAAKANANQAILAKCGNYFSRIIPKINGGEFYSITVHFHKDVLTKIYSTTPPDFLKNTYSDTGKNATTIGTKAIIKSYFESVRTFFDHQSELTEDILALKLKEIILLLSNLKDKNVASIMANLFHYRTFEFKEVIEAHICSEISIAELAQLTNRSLSTFKRDFFAIYNETPSNYIVGRRLERAAKLFKISDDTVSQIVFDSGFKSLSHFNRIFKAKYNMTPTVYRNNC